MRQGPHTREHIPLCELKGCAETRMRQVSSLYVRPRDSAPEAITRAKTKGDLPLPKYTVLYTVRS